MQINEKAGFNPAQDKESFAAIDSLLDAGNRNAAQGVLGRQLGLTKVVNMKMKMKELQKNIEKEISAVQAEVKVKEPTNLVLAEGQDESELEKQKTAEISKSQLEHKSQDKEYAALENEIKLVGKMIPKVEKLEKDLEILDANDNGKDPELVGITEAMEKVMKKSKAQIKEKRETNEKKKVEKEKKAQDEEYAFVPKQGFDWDNVSGAITDVI